MLCFSRKFERSGLLVSSFILRTKYIDEDSESRRDLKRKGQNSERGISNRYYFFAEKCRNQCVSARAHAQTPVQSSRRVSERGDQRQLLPMGDK